ncbi:MAG: NAD+ synthase [Nitrospiraceae bacterium]|nr:NAD+ synthase [Nitrospiraceae bacterium]
MKTLRIALAQINPIVGDIEGNTSKICDYMEKAKQFGAKIVVFPELAITGYPPEDLLLKKHFINDNLNALDRINKNTDNITAIIGFIDSNNGIYNSAAILSNQVLIGKYHKTYLPNYGVFDEFRYFKAGTSTPVYKTEDITIGINICEDIWSEQGPVKSQAAQGAKLIFNISASPYHMGKILLREQMLSSRASENKVVIAYLNTVGGQDELVFDGGSLIVNEKGLTIARARQFEEEMVVKDLTFPMEVIENISACKLSIEEEVYKALVLGTSDYVKKNDFKKVVIGISGGIDSALVASIAADAIGRENVIGVFMPSKFTSKESNEDAKELAKNLCIKILEVPIDAIFKSYLKILNVEFNKTTVDITEENLQARIRGNILMAFSNKFGWLVLTTGNKSEMSVGYATLYGDMAGGFAVIKDVPKTLVYDLCRWKNFNEGRAAIPNRVITKDPSAELKPEQKDSDTLPPYALLDPILKAYIEDDKSFEDIISEGYDKECVERVIKMVNKSEYKRRQSPPGIKITPKAFGKDRRFPITNKYRSY